jgi:hypothetical protein
MHLYRPPSQTGWVLSQISIGEDARVPGAIPAPELKAWLQTLIDRLVRAGLP